MLEIARFWGSMCKLNPKTGRYEISGVMGPDEFHEKYPASKCAGLANNSYTNIMVAWLLDKISKVLEILPKKRRHELLSLVGCGPEELEKWVDITNKMTVIFHSDLVLSQFQGWCDLKVATATCGLTF